MIFTVAHWFQIKSEKEASFWSSLYLRSVCSRCNIMHQIADTFFKNFPEVTPPNPLSVLEPTFWSHSLQNPGCSPDTNGIERSCFGKAVFLLATSMTSIDRMSTSMEYINRRPTSAVTCFQLYLLIRFINARSIS